ncbi:MAG TPA: zf-HC2 domain-containing protein [Ktedonobacteraceae bacterium]|jgi:anti-sigma factor RsiW
MDTELSCQQARAMVSAYMNQEVDAEQAQALESHLHHCTSCPALYASLVAVQQRLHQSHRSTLSPQDVLRIARRVSDALGDKHNEPPSSEGTTF